MPSQIHHSNQPRHAQPAPSCPTSPVMPNQPRHAQPAPSCPRKRASIPSLSLEDPSFLFRYSFWIPAQGGNDGSFGNIIH